MNLKFKIIILFLPLLALLLIESNNAIMWWSLHTKSKVETNYTPQKKHLDKIQVSKNDKDVKWLNSSEIYYQKHLYDVKYIESSNNGYIIYVEKDVEETKLLSNLNKSSKHKKKSQRTKNQLIKVLKNDYFNLYTISNLNESKNKVQSQYLLKAYTTYTPKTTPPPKNFFMA